MSIRSSAVGLAVVVVLMGAGTAQSLTGSNTVFTDDIANGHVRVADIGAGAVGSSEIVDNSIRSADVGNNLMTGDDVNESTIPGFRKTYFARVNSAGVLHSTIGGATSAAKDITGSYFVTFPFTVEGCAATANVGFHPGQGGLVIDSYSAMPAIVSGQQVVTVITRNTTSAQDLPFMLILTCP